MRERLASPSQRRAFGRGGINLVEDPRRANTVPYASILIASLLPFWLIADVMPIIPPLGFMAFLGWRLMRPGFMPLWAGVPLGAFDDLFSGQPFGSAILLWSLTMIAIEIVETRFPWRGFWQDWFTAGLTLAGYIFLAMLVSGAPITVQMVLAIAPQILVAVSLYPLLVRLIARLDTYRLYRTRRVA